jgi:hypothetical protein
MSITLAHALVPEIPTALVVAIVAPIYLCGVLSVWLAFKGKKRAAIWLGSSVTVIAGCAVAPSIAFMVFDWWLIYPGLLLALGITGILLAVLRKRPS